MLSILSILFMLSTILVTKRCGQRVQVAAQQRVHVRARAPVRARVRIHCFCKSLFVVADAQQKGGGDAFLSGAV